MQNVIVLVPHPDDEVLGFGGTIQKHIAKGNSVHVMFVEQTHAEERYRIQAGCALDSASTLSFTFSWLGVTENELLNPTLEVVSNVESCLAEKSPDILYIPHPGDTHQYHTAVFNIARAATRIQGRAPIKQIYCGEILSSTDSCINMPHSKFNPNHYEALTEKQVELKWQALSKYYLEVNNYPHPRSRKGIYVGAQKRGMEAGTEYAEAFECMRFVS